MKIKERLQFNKEHGSATIEAIISFTGFLFVIFTILNVVNICRAQMLISNAVDTATKELTQYSYFYEMSGLSKFKEDLDGQAEIGASNLNEIIGTVDNFTTTVGGAYDNSVQHKTNLENAAKEGSLDMDTIQNEIRGVENDVNKISNSITTMEAAFGDVAGNPLKYMKSIVAVAGSEFIDIGVSHAIAAPLSKSFFTKHFGSNRQEASKELERLGVVGGLDGMNFKMSTMFSKAEPDEVHIVVYYKLKLIQLFEWANLEVPMCKESVACAWLGGDDVKKKVTPMPPVEKPAEDEGGETTEDGEKTEDTKEEAKEENKEEEPKKEDTENVNTTNSYWNMTPEEKSMAYMNGELKNGMGMDYLGMYYINGAVITNQTTFIAQQAGDAEMKRDKPKDFAQSYTITKGDEKTDSYLSVCTLGALNRIGANLESQDGDKEVKRTYTFNIYVPENISEEDYKQLEDEIEDAEFLIDLQVKGAEKGEPNSFYPTLATNTEYSFKIIKAGGNYDYGSGK